MRFLPRPSSKSQAMKFSLCAGVGLAALMSTPVLSASAQETDQAEDGQRRLNAVVVEATRRAGTTVQDVPVSVTAFDAALLEDAGVARLTTLSRSHHRCRSRSLSLPLRVRAYLSAALVPVRTIQVLSQLSAS